MAKTKSRSDIIQQLIRIEDYGNEARADRADKIAKRYINNIRNTRSYQRAIEKAEKAIVEKGEDAGFAILRGTRSRQYSRNTYMGLNQG